MTEKAPKSSKKPMSPYNRALDILAIRAHSVKELRTKLLKRDFSPVEVEAVLARLLDNGLLNDSSYAESYVRGKLGSGSASPRRVAQKLAQKGVGKELIESALEFVVQNDEIDPREALEALAHKKLRQIKDEDHFAVKRKLFAFLARRGYDLGDIQDVVGRLVRR